MKRENKLAVLATVSACIVTAGSFVYADDEKAVSLSDVPVVVKDAAARVAPGIKLTEAEIEKKKSGMIYELKGKVDDKEYEIKVTSEGKILKAKEGAEDSKGDAEKEESSKTVSLSDVPAAVKDAAARVAPGIKLTEAEIEKKKSGMVYELEGSVDGKEYEIKVTPEGKIIKFKEEKSGFFRNLFRSIF